MRKLRILCLWALLLAYGAAEAQQYQVGVCDWMILKRQKLGEFELARYIGADGVELDMGSLGQRKEFDNQLRNPAQAALFKHTADSLDIKIGAVAMSGMYAQSLAGRDNYRELVEDCLNTMDVMGGVRVAFLPLGGCGNNWADSLPLRKVIVKRLHEVGEMAKARGKVLGIDTPLDAKGNKKLLKEIKSDGIAIFYKFQTAIELGLDICKDMQALGAKNICAIHASNTDGVWIQNDKALNMPAIKATLDKMQWSGWLFIERSRDVNQVRNVKNNYGSNVRYMKEIFNSVPEPEVKLNADGRDPEYVNNILGRAKKCTDALDLTWSSAIGDNVRNIVANRYFELNDIYAERDSLKKAGNKNASQVADSKLYRSHFGFEEKLSKYLMPRHVERVKDVMTFNVVKVTYDAYCDMIPTLKDDEKEQIMRWLREARELAIDEESSNKKHAVFNKYKGRINNFLSARGYNVQKEREEWEKRVKARGGRL